MVVMKYLKDYVEDGRYTIIVSSRMKSLMIKIKELYPTAVVTTSDADGIGGKKLLVDKWAADGLGLKAALPKYRTQDVVYENFTKQFFEGGNVTVKFSSEGYDEWIANLIGVPVSILKEKSDASYHYYKSFFDAEVWKQKLEEIIGTNKPLSEEDISYELNGEVPKLYIKGKEVGVVSTTMHYVTASEGLGTKTVTFVYLTENNPEQKVLSINSLGEVFEQ